jgi:hypothetical protein
MTTFPAADQPLPAGEQELLADAWMEAMDWLDAGDAGAGLALLGRGFHRAQELTAPWQPILERRWQAALERYPAAEAGEWGVAVAA